MIRIMRADDVNIEECKTPEIHAGNDVERAVDEIIQDVRARGDRALTDYAKKFDRAEIGQVAVPESDIDEAMASADPKFIGSLRGAKANIEQFHTRQVRHGFIISEREGVTLGQRIIPLNRVGLYVPGGTASYPSSVLMNAIPAKLAGVNELIIATPPTHNGKVAPAILCAARIAGVDKIMMMGGAQAIAALAYGTESVPAVDKIVGPGNIYVATAKRRVYGIIDIDMIAGPSEILVVADDDSNPRHVAADMLSQAEHDVASSAILICTSEKLAFSVQAELEAQIPKLARQAIARQSIDENSRIIIAPSLQRAVEISNIIAPEHLELMVDEPFALLGAVKNAGSVFLGRYSPEALGDYWAGPNHTLPTSGTARFSSPLSVDDFIKKSQFMCYNEAALMAAKDDIARLAVSEGLTGHAMSVLTRFGEAL